MDIETDAVKLVQMRNQFYRNKYRNLVKAVLLCLLIALVLLGIIFYLITHRPKPDYFATTVDGHTLPLIALSRPNQSDSTILQWANEAAVAVYTMNFVDYRQRLQEASEYFTPDGWDNYLHELELSNNLDAIISKKMVMHAVATDVPVILRQYNSDVGYSWQVQMPMLVSVESASQTIQQPLTITMLITRVSTLDNPKGIAIVQFVATPRV